jgi:hypothetical protein
VTPVRTPPLEGRELLGPTVVVGSVQAEVDDVGALAYGGRELGVGGVAGDVDRTGELLAT